MSRQWIDKLRWGLINKLKTLSVESYTIALEQKAVALMEENQQLKKEKAELMESHANTIRLSNEYLATHCTKETARRMAYQMADQAIRDFAERAKRTNQFYRELDMIIRDCIIIQNLALMMLSPGQSLYRQRLKKLYQELIQQYSVCLSKVGTDGWYNVAGTEFFDLYRDFVQDHLEGCRKALLEDINGNYTGDNGDLLRKIGNRQGHESIIGLLDEIRETIDFGGAREQDGTEYIALRGNQLKEVYRRSKTWHEIGYMIKLEILRIPEIERTEGERNALMRLEGKRKLDSIVKGAIGRQQDKNRSLPVANDLDELDLLTPG